MEEKPNQQQQHQQPQPVVINHITLNEHEQQP